MSPYRNSSLSVKPFCRKVFSQLNSTHLVYINSFLTLFSSLALVSPPRLLLLHQVSQVACDIISDEDEDGDDQDGDDHGYEDDQDGDYYHCLSGCLQ